MRGGLVLLLVCVLCASVLYSNAIIPPTIINVGGSGGNGTVGPAGPAGPAGPPGLAGMNGTNGINGVNGTDGVPGVPGVNGSDGHDGAPGIDGAPGFNGTGFFINYSVSSSCSDGGFNLTAYTVDNGMFFFNWSVEVCNGSVGPSGNGTGSSWLFNAPWLYNDTTTVYWNESLAFLSWLNISDQRYNETALIDALNASTNMSVYVPYDGAVADVNLGVMNLNTTGTVTTDYFYTNGGESLDSVYLFDYGLHPRVIVGGANYSGFIQTSASTPFSFSQINIGVYDNAVNGYVFVQSTNGSGGTLQPLQFWVGANPSWSILPTTNNFVSGTNGASAYNITTGGDVKANDFIMNSYSIASWLTNINASKLNVSDQRYNDTVMIQNINASIINYSQWIIDVNDTKLNVSDQRYNDSATFASYVPYTGATTNVLLGSYNVSASNFKSTGNVNNYFEMNIQNTNNGSQASSDYVATNNEGDATNYYIDMGINSGNYSQTAYNASGRNDGYLYVMNGSLQLGTATPTKNITFTPGGLNSYNITTQMSNNQTISNVPLVMAKQNMSGTTYYGERGQAQIYYNGSTLVIQVT